MSYSPATRSFRKDLFTHGLDELDEAERKHWQASLGESNQIFTGAMLAETEARKRRHHEQPRRLHAKLPATLARPVNATARMLSCRMTRARPAGGL